MSAPVFLMRHLGGPETGFFWLFGPAMMGLMSGSWLSGRLAGRITARQTIKRGYLIMGAIWFYMHQANYPFVYITPPVAGTELGDAALKLIPWLGPHLLGEPAIYFAVILAFVFVLVVFI